MYDLDCFKTWTWIDGPVGGMQELLARSGGMGTRHVHVRGVSSHLAMGTYVAQRGSGRMACP